MGDKTAWSSGAIIEADINTYLSHTGGAWNNWSPIVTQSGTVTVATSHARYFRAGRLITFYTALTVSGSGTGSNNVTMSLPVTAAASGFTIPGSGLIFDNSASTNYPGIPYIASTTTVALVPSADNANGVLGSVGGFTAALAVGDLIQIAGTYEAAT